MRQGESIDYEWVCEPVDKYEDIIDPMFGDTLESVKGYLGTFDEAVDYDIALVKNHWSDVNGLEDRWYAYLAKPGFDEFEEDPEFKIPKKYKIEVAKRCTE